jgi:hypothetical protein
MTNLSDAYNKFCLNELGFSGVWPVDGAALEIGTFGTWDNGKFSIAGRIQDLRINGAIIQMDISDKQLIAGPLVANSTTMKRSEFNASGQASGDVGDSGTASGSASVTYSASAAESFSVSLDGVYSQTLTNSVAVLEQVASAFDHDPNIKWNDRYRIITEVWTADSYFMFGTVSSSSKVTVSGSASAILDFMSGKIGAGLAETRSSDGSLQVLENRVPKAVGLKFAAIRQLSPFAYDLDVVHYS